MNCSQLNDLKNVGKQLRIPSTSATQTSMNAVTLGILLHYYWNPERYVGIRGAAYELSEAETKGIHYLIGNYLLEENSGEIGITDCGRCHIEAILNAPYPVQGWTSPIRQIL